MTDQNLCFNFKMKPEAYYRRFKRLIQRRLCMYESPRFGTFKSYVDKELQRQLSIEPLPEETFLKVDFSWGNHYYIVGKVTTSSNVSRFGGELIWMPKEEESQGKFRGDLEIMDYSNNKMPLDFTHDSRWQEYEHHIKLYQNYLDIGLKANMFFYGITGGILAFIYNADGKGLKFILALLLPILMSFSFGIVYLYGAHRWREVTFIIRVLKRQLGMKRAPDVQILSLLLLFFGIISMGVGVVLTIAMIGWKYIPPT